MPDASAQSSARAVANPPEEPRRRIVGVGGEAFPDLEHGPPALGERGDQAISCRCRRCAMARPGQTARQSEHRAQEPSAVPAGCLASQKVDDVALALRCRHRRRPRNPHTSASEPRPPRRGCGGFVLKRWRVRPYHLAFLDNGPPPLALASAAARTAPLGSGPATESAAGPDSGSASGSSSASTRRAEPPVARRAGPRLRRPARRRPSRSRRSPHRCPGAAGRPPRTRHRCCRTRR